MNIGTSISKVRKGKKVTQKVLSQKSGITPAYLSQVERNLKIPNLSTLKKIADSLDTTVPALLFLAFDKQDIKEDMWELFQKISPKVQSLIVGGSD